MYYLLSLLGGALIAVMVVINGRLTALVSAQFATVIIHVVGLFLIGTIAVLRRDRAALRPQKWYLYLGGVIGVATTMCNVLAFSRISVSALLALALFGESLTGLVIDQYGLLGHERHPFARRKLLGLALLVAGIASMLTELDAFAVALCVIAGICTVVSRILNGTLGQRTSVTASTLLNYITGLLVAVPLCALLSAGETLRLPDIAWREAYIYLGGALGVVIVLMSVVIVTKIPTLYMTLAMFVGQIFAGILLDILLTGAFSARNLIGGVLVAAGLCLNLWFDRKKQASHGAAQGAASKP